MLLIINKPMKLRSFDFNHPINESMRGRTYFMFCLFDMFGLPHQFVRCLFTPAINSSFSDNREYEA